MVGITMSKESSRLEGMPGRCVIALRTKGAFCNDAGRQFTRSRTLELRSEPSRFDEGLVP